MVPLFGRSWKVQVLTPEDQGNQTLLTVSSSDTETQALRVTFDIEQVVFKTLWYAEINIYNPNLQTFQTIVEGSQVSVAAGYQSEGTPTEIFRGDLFQAIWSKEDANTVVLTLLCFVGLPEMTDSFVQTTLGPRATQRQIVLAMAAGCKTGNGASAPISIAYLAPDSDFMRGPLPRSTTIFGTPSALFANVATANDMAFFHGHDGVHFGKVAGGSTKPDVVYAPPLQAGQTPESGVDYRLIGTPQQTQQGVVFRVLLDSRLTVKLPCMQAQLKNAVITQQPFQVGNFQSLLTQDGVYFVIGVRFIGDTRSNPWEAQVTAVTSADAILALAGGGIS